MVPRDPDGSGASAAQEENFEAVLGDSITGYRMVRVLGAGGSGKVYEVQAPGGFAKALKVVHLDSRNPLTQRELDGLRVIRAIRHPYLISIDRLDVDEAKVTIVMELADCNLRDEFERVSSEGRPGVERMQLLQWLREAAEVLDLLNLRYDVQHLDVKPENLFLVSRHLKVGDYGLARQTENGSLVLDNRSNAISPAFAAPELFEGKVSQSSDQYGLAVVYMEMLTGRRPYAGADVRQLAFEHVSRQPNVNFLPPTDRSIVAKALSRNPKDRFESCEDFVKALLTYPDVTYVPSTPATSYGEQTETDATSAFFEDGLEPTPLGQGLLESAPVAAISELEAHVTSVHTAWYLAKLPPEMFLQKLEHFVSDWNAELYRLNDAAVAVRFEAATGWLRNLVGLKQWLLATLRLFQRQDEVERTLVEVTISYHGKKLPEKDFLQYVRKVTALFGQQFLGAEAPANRIRRHPRLRIDVEVSVRFEDSTGEKTYRCRAVDVAARGIGLRSDHAIPLGRVRIRLPGSDEPLMGRVLHCQPIEGGLYRVGVSFAQDVHYPESFLRLTRRDTKDSPDPKED